MITMKDFSKEWKSSKKPRKQRKYRANAPKHVQGKFLSAHLSQDLREEYGKRSIRLRKGDKVEVMRGDHAGETGEVQEFDIDRQKVYLTDLEITRRDGSKAKPPVRPSNLKVIELNKEDQKRMEKIGGEVEPQESEDKEESEDDTEEGVEDDVVDVPSESEVRGLTKDEMKEFASDEFGIELSTNDLKDEMVEQFMEELEEQYGDKE